MGYCIGSCCLILFHIASSILAPSTWMMFVARQFPHSPHCLRGSPFMSPARNPAAYMSPAPVVSITFTLFALMFIVSSPLLMIEPFFPTFTMAISQRDAMKSNALSGASPVSALASSSLAKTISMSFNVSVRKSRLSSTTRSSCKRCSSKRRGCFC